MNLHTQYSGYEYLLIGAADAYGLDKLEFEKRIQWANNNMHQLEDLVGNADDVPLYIKGVAAIRDAQAGIATGHMVGLDACSSGLQIMGALTGCYETCRSTGLIDPHVRPDAYKTATDIINTSLGGGVTVPRRDMKQAVMTHFYGSKMKPIEVLGEDTPAYHAFFPAVAKMCPGAYQLCEGLLQSWQPFALQHSWTLPDGFEAVCKVYSEDVKIIEVDELNHATFSHTYRTMEGTETGLSNAAK